MKKPTGIIDFTKIIDPFKNDISDTNYEIKKFKKNLNEETDEIEILMKRIEELSSKIGIPSELNVSPNNEITVNKELDLLLEGFEGKECTKLPQLNSTEITVSIISGLIAVLIDVIFVGTPELIKIYKGGENFDGSRLTGVLRNLTDSEDSKLAPAFKWLSDKCKVTYDISAKKGIVTPNNHRLRSLSHDPFFGLLFAVADILMGTTTCIDNNGKLSILPSPTKASSSQKWFAVIYYMGHIVSDVCTSRGIPVPGFFLTQFFTNEIGGASVNNIAQSMYLDGYDLRHMASMSVPVLVKEMLINIYLKMNQETTAAISTIAEKEKQELDFELKTYKMKFIADSIATSGNLVKFISPPVSGNPCAINMVQWMSFIRNGAIMLKAKTRDASGEEIIFNRNVIDKRWELLKNNE
jgi:hypothetical protein